MHSGAPTFQGLKITQDVGSFVRFKGKLKWVFCDRHKEHLVFDPPGTVGWGGNSGFHTINLAVLFGARKLILVGYDMQLKGGIHWHGPHRHGLNNPSTGNVERWRRVVDDAAPLLQQMGVKVINASLVSALKNYPKMTFDAALDA